MHPRLLLVFSAWLGACSAASSDTGDTEARALADSAVDTDDSSTDTADWATDTAVDTGNVDWRAIASGYWSSEMNGPCDTVVAAVVTSADEVQPWFEGVRYSASDGGGAPASVSDGVDWSTEVALLASIECLNTSKVLSVSSIDESAGVLTVELHLVHPGLDSGIETTYWTAAAIPLELASSALIYTLTEETESPPP